MVLRCAGARLRDRGLDRGKTGMRKKNYCAYCNDPCRWQLCAWCWIGAVLAAIGTAVVGALANDAIAWIAGR